MDLFNLWPMDMGGQATAEEARQRRASRFDEPLPYPARKISQMAQGFVDPFIHFGDPGTDPIAQAVGLGMMGISPFRGAIATARPRMTPQEELWGRAQQGDIQATGQLTGDMWRRDLAEIPAMEPDPLYPDTQIRAPRAEPEIRARPGYVEPDDDYITMAPVPKGLFEQPPPGGWGAKTPLSPEDAAALVPPKPPEIGERVGDFIWDGQEWQFMDYMPPEGNVPPRVPNDWSAADDAMKAALERGAAPRMGYDEWQGVLQRMNASPNVLPRINPFPHHLYRPGN